MSQYRVVVLAVFLAGALFLVYPSGSVRGATPQTVTRLAVSTTSQLDQKGQVMKGQYLVVAVLTSAGGQPVSNEQVAFFEQTTFIGAVRAAALGTTKTDAGGTAAVVYQPAQAGPHTLLAQFGGDNQYAASKGETNIQVQATNLEAPFPPQATPLASVGHWLTVVVELFVLLFWMFLLWLFLRTVLGIWLAARHPATNRVGTSWMKRRVYRG